MKLLSFWIITVSLLTLSCGKSDNKVGNGNGNGNAGLSCSNARVGVSGNAPAVVTYTELIAQVENDNFSRASDADWAYSFALSSDYVYQSLSSSNFKFRYLNSDGTIERNNVPVTQNNYTRYFSYPEDAEFGNNLCELKRKLLEIMKNATSVKKCGQRTYEDMGYNCIEVKYRTANNSSGSSGLINMPTNVMIFTYKGKEYTIDTSREMIKNPVFRK